MSFSNSFYGSFIAMQIYTIRKVIPDKIIRFFLNEVNTVEMQKIKALCEKLKIDLITYKIPKLDEELFITGE